MNRHATTEPPLLLTVVAVAALMLTVGVTVLLGLLVWRYDPALASETPQPLGGGAPAMDLGQPRQSRCGAPGNDPPRLRIVAPWNEYRCLDASSAGDAWANCLERAEYASQRGEGCPGAQLCCPPTKR